MTVSNPASTGASGALFEGQVGAQYLLTLLIGAEPRGLPGTKIERVEFQRAPEGYPLDDIVIQARGSDGHAAVLEVQVKRTLKFTKSDQQFGKVVAQIAKASQRPDFFDNRHELAVAVARASQNVQGPYQDVLTWARQVGPANTLTDRIERPGSANEPMRSFVDAFRTCLENTGAAHDDETVWRLLSRFLILPFDFTALGSAHEAHQRERAVQALQPDDGERAEALWQYLVQLSIETATSGGQFNSDELKERVRIGGFSLVGEYRYSSARSALAEDARHALEDIADRIGTVRLLRGEHLSDIRSALDQGRYVEIRGEPGVGKSGLLKRSAEEQSAQSRIVVLSPGRVRSGGWGAMRAALGLQGTARAFLVDLASSGGATLFIDGMEFFSPEERLTVVDLVREAANIPGFSVVATTRYNFGGEDDESDWLPPRALALLGRVPVTIKELSEEEVSELRLAAPELTPLLADTHPAKAVVRNLFRLERLARCSAGETPIRTEIEMAVDWWQTADGEKEGRRERIRLLKTLAKQTLAMEQLNAEIHPGAAVDALIESGTLRDLGSDRIAFRHDILRDWAVANLLFNEPDIVKRAPLDNSAPALLARGFELAARMKIERVLDDAGWLSFLHDVSHEKIHSSWRRNVLLSLVRSEIGEQLLTRAMGPLLADDSKLLVELIRTIQSVEVHPLREHLVGLGVTLPETVVNVHVPYGPSWIRLTLWILGLGTDFPEAVTEEVADFFATLCVIFSNHPELSGLLAHWFYSRLEGIDVRRSYPLASKLRSGFFIVCHGAPLLATSYLRSLKQCDVGDEAIRSVWKFSSYVAQAAPEELAELTLTVLIPRKKDRRYPLTQGLPVSLSDLPPSEWAGPGRRPFDSNDVLLAPPSPKQGPFLALLEYAPTIGLKLVRQLIDHAISVRCQDRPGSADTISVAFSDGPRVFSFLETYAWSRVWGNGDPCVQSSLMALETWAHRRIEKNEEVETVLADALPQSGGPAAYLLVAADLILSHWSNSAKAAIPFVACPELLCLDMQRNVSDQVPLPDVLGLNALLGQSDDLPGSDELNTRPSRRYALDSLLDRYAISGPSRSRVELVELMQRAVERLGPYGEQDHKLSPKFMATHALNRLDPANWRKISKICPNGQSVGTWEYVSPPEEMEHLERPRTTASQTMADQNMQLSLCAAVENKSCSSPEFASKAMEWVFRSAVPTVGDCDEDIRRRNLAKIAAAVVAMRDGDEDLRIRHREWARDVFLEALATEPSTQYVPEWGVSPNPVAMAFVGIASLLRNEFESEDVRTLLEAVSRQDLLAVSGFHAAAEMIAAADERLPRAILRTAFVACIFLRREHPGYSPDIDIERRVRSTLDGECRWLSGEGDEPDWPKFPMVSPTHIVELGTPPVTVELSDGISYPVGHPKMEEIFDDQCAAVWLKSTSSMFDVRAHPWLRDLAQTYAEWTAVANGRNMEPHDRVKRIPSDWNTAYFNLVARCLPGLSEENIKHLALDQIRSLPDESFFDVTGCFLLSVDQVYLGNGGLEEEEAVRIRALLADRLSETSDWRLRSSDPAGSMEVRMGSATAAFFFNRWNRLPPSSCYLLEPGIARIEPFLPVLERLAVKGPGGFVAGLVLDLVEVSPQPAHLPFIAAAAEAWLVEHPDNTKFWVDSGTADRFCIVVNRIGIHEPCSAWDPLLRDRVGHIVSALVGLGVPLAGRLEQVLADADDDRR